MDEDTATERVEFLKALRDLAVDPGSRQVPCGELPFWEHEAANIYHCVFGTGGPVTYEMMVRAHSFGMLKFNELQDCKTYVGYCRNATTATWDAERKTFVILRQKFGREVLEETPYPHADDCFDIFVPVCEWERPRTGAAATDYITNNPVKENDDG